MKRKFKLIVPSFLTLIFCLLLIAGSTFAIFSSQAEASIEVTSGKVHVTASLTGLQAYSAEADDSVTNTSDNWAGEVTSGLGAGKYKYVAATSVTNSETPKFEFATKGTAELTNDKTLILNNIVPGDKVTLKLTLTNSSNVDVKYRVRLNAIEDNGLLDGLKVKVNGTELLGTIKNTAWLPFEDDEIDMPLEVLLPITAGNEYQEKTAKLRFTVEMVQGNAKVDSLLDEVNAYLANANQSAQVNKTMFDAIAEATAYKPAFVATNYVWNMDTDQFYAEDNVVTGQGFEGRFFKAYGQADMPALADQKFGIYATGAWTNPVNVVVGFDAGDATGISNVSYVRTGENVKAQEVVIRTNSASTAITINAPKDIVHHYGVAGSLDIIAVAGQSYHEFGYVPQAQIAQGRIVNEAGSVETEDGTTKKAGVENLFIVAATEGSGSTAGTFSDVIVEAAQGAEVPSLDRSDVNIVGSVLVVEVKTSSSDDFVYLTKAGIVEQVVVTTEKNATSATAKAGSDATLNATASKAADEIANIAKRNAQGQVLAADGTTPIEDISTITSVEQIAIAEPKATKADLEKSQGEDALYAGGLGTKGNPYLITSEDWWFKFAQLCKEDSDYSETNGKYFKVTSDINVGKYESGTLNILYFAGNIDFNNHKLFGWNDAIITDGIGAFVGGFDQLSNATIQNLDFYTYLVKNQVQLSITSEPSGVCVLKNCNVYGNCDPANWNNTGFFVVYPRCSSLTLENCNNYANLINSGYSSAFIGNILAADDCDIYFKNCNNYANIISTNKGASMLIANPSLPVNNNKGRTYNIHIENCNNYGVICGTEDYMNLVIPTNNLYPNPNYTLLKVNGTNINTGSPSQAERYNRIVQSIENSMSGTNVSKLTINSLSTTNGYFDCAEIANAAKYVLSFGFTPSNRNGARYGYNMTFDTVPENIKVGSWIAKSELDVNATIDAHMGEGTEYYTSGDYYVYHDDQGTILDKVKVAYIVYGDDGNIIYLASYTYQD